MSRLRIQQVDEEAEGAGDGFGELAVEGEGAVGPAAAAELDGDEAAALGGLGFDVLGGGAGVVGFGQGGVVRVPGVEEAVAALFDPVVEVGGGDLVGGGEERRVGVENLDGGGFVDDALVVVGEGVGGVGGGELGGLVLDDDVAAVAGEVEQGLGGRAVEVGVGVVGADAEDDGVELREVGGGEVGDLEDGGREADGGEGGGDVVAGAGEVGDAAFVGLAGA